MEKPMKKTNYTKFTDIDGANDYARSNEKDLANIFQYVGNMGVTQTVTISANTSDCGVFFNSTNTQTYPYVFYVYTNCTSAYNLYRNGDYNSY